MQKDILKEFNTNMQSLLEQGVIFWRQPWTSQSVGFHMPVNASTGALYKGVNIWSLNAVAHIQNWQTPHYATYKQWSDLGEQVKAGSKGAPIYKFDTIEWSDDAETVKKIPYMKKYTVFNRCQLASFKGAEKPDQPNLVESIEHFDQFMANTGAVIKTSQDLGACYDLGPDVIYMPPKAKFIDDQGVSATVNWYDTLAHEVTHWTGAEHRLNRKVANEYGEKAYAEEELIAELGAVLLLDHLKIISEPTPGSVAYAALWSKRLGADENLFWRAAAESSKAFDYLAAFQQNLMVNDNQPVQQQTPKVA